MLIKIEPRVDYTDEVLVTLRLVLVSILELGLVLVLVLDVVYHPLPSFESNA